MRTTDPADTGDDSDSEDNADTGEDSGKPAHEPSNRSPTSLADALATRLIVCAIQLSTFVMIGQTDNQPSSRPKQIMTFNEQERTQTNTELTRAIHTRTTELHRDKTSRTSAHAADRAWVPEQTVSSGL